MAMTDLLARLGSFAPLLVFALAAAESAAFVGVFAPGELAVILGGVAAGTGSTSLGLVAAAAVTGAIVGDSIGYWIGSRLGPNVLGSRPRLAKVTAHLEAASQLVATRGWWALVAARFVAVLRAVVPLAAGAGQMPYRRFLLGNVIGGVAWGVAFTLVGYFAGANYPTAERWLRTGGLAVVAFLVVVGGIIWLTRWARVHREALLARVRRVAARRPFRWVASGVQASNRPGAVLAGTGIALVGGSWLFAGLLQDVLGSEEFFFFDVSAIDYLDRHRVGALVGASRVINAVTVPVWALLALGVMAAVVASRRRWRHLAAIVVAAAGQWAIVALTQLLVDRTPPGVAALVTRVDYGFPSEHVALASTLVLLLAWPWDGPGWRPTVTRFGVAAVVIALTGMARIVLLVEYPSDVIAAAAVTSAWTLLTCLVLDRRRPVEAADTMRAEPHDRDQ
jgi:membrane protein DedA with SNARE-associated domain/membrane-associated phospholipid phosphatase